MTFDARDLLRPVLQLGREAPVWGRLGAARLDPMRSRQTCKGTVVFLPSGPRAGSALMRIHNIAAHLRTRGWLTHVIPWTLKLGQRRRLLSAMSPDVIVMQGARHKLNRPELYPEYPVVYDMDDADFHLSHLEAPVRAAMPQVQGVMAGSVYIANWCRRAGARNVHVVWTGSPVASIGNPPPQTARPWRIAWAQTRPMTYPHEAELVRRVAADAALALGGVTLRLYDRQDGDDPGFAESFGAPGLRVEWVRRMNYRRYLRSLDTTAVGLAPLRDTAAFCRGKGFGKVLAYLDRRIPVVATATGEPARFLDSRTGIVSSDVNALSAGVVSLLKSPSARSRMAEAAYSQYRSRLSVEAVGARVEEVLQRVILQDHLTLAKAV